MHCVSNAYVAGVDNACADTAMSYHGSVGSGSHGFLHVVTWVNKATPFKDSLSNAKAMTDEREQIDTRYEYIATCFFPRNGLPGQAFDKGNVFLLEKSYGSFSIDASVVIISARVPSVYDVDRFFSNRSNQKTFNEANLV